MDMTYTVFTLHERPDLIDAIDHLHQIGWVPFMREDPIAAQYWRQLLDSFPQFQYVLVDEASTPVACGNAIPFHWDGSDANLPSGWDGVFEQGISDHEQLINPDTLSALAIVIHPDERGKGLSTLMVKEMKRVAVEKWEEWTGMRLPSSGSYILEGGLVPLQIDKEKNTGVYIEPNVWMRHTL